MKRKTVWLLLADGQRASVYRYLGAEQMPEAETDMDFERKGAPTRDIRTDKPGQMQPGGGGSSAAFAPRTDAHEVEEERFLDHVAQKLGEAVAAGRCDSLILAAPPKALGHLRNKLTPATQKLIKAEIDKDFTKTERAKLGKLVAQHLAG